jgi:hypothetical protein
MSAIRHVSLNPRWRQRAVRGSVFAVGGAVGVQQHVGVVGRGQQVGAESTQSTNAKVCLLDA